MAIAFPFFRRKSKAAPPREGTHEAEDANEDVEIEGDRGLPSVNTGRSAQSKLARAVMMTAGILVLGVLLTKYYMAGMDRHKEENKIGAKQKAPEQAKPSNAKSAGIFDFPVPPPVAPPPEMMAGKVPKVKTNYAAGELPPEGEQGAVMGNGFGQEPDFAPAGPGQKRPMTEAQKELQARLQDPVAGGHADALKTSGAAMDAFVPPKPVQAGNSDQRQSGGLVGNLKGSYTPTVEAKMLPDRNFVIAKGTFIDCKLEFEMDSSLSGMTACHTQDDAWSDNGRVVLMEKGTYCTGEYRGDMKPGQTRIFVLWAQCKTPNGVTIDLDSIATDSIGRTGVDGHVDNHFWDRFGAGILMTTIEMAGTALNTKRTGNGNLINQANSTTQNAQNLAMEMIKPTINLPATLQKHRGESVSIYVARHLSFRSVYSLKHVEN